MVVEVVVAVVNVVVVVITSVKRRTECTSGWRSSPPSWLDLIIEMAWGFNEGVVVAVVFTSVWRGMGFVSLGCCPGQILSLRDEVLDLGGDGGVVVDWCCLLPSGAKRNVRQNGPLGRRPG